MVLYIVFGPINGEELLKKKHSKKISYLDLDLDLHQKSSWAGRSVGRDKSWAMQAQRGVVKSYISTPESPAPVSCECEQDSGTARTSYSNYKLLQHEERTGAVQVVTVATRGPLLDLPKYLPVSPFLQFEWVCVRVGAIGVLVYLDNTFVTFLPLFVIFVGEIYSEYCCPNTPCLITLVEGEDIAFGSICLSVCLSVCLFVRTELSCFSPHPLVGLRQKFQQRCDSSYRMF